MDLQKNCLINEVVDPLPSFGVFRNRIKPKLINSIMMGGEQEVNGIKLILISKGRGNVLFYRDLYIDS